jgi:hypothetical protein
MPEVSAGKLLGKLDAVTKGELMAHPNGLFAWTDVSVPDTDAGKAFYSAVMGWNATQVPPLDSPMPYWSFTTGHRMAAGMGRSTPEQQAQGLRPAWWSYVAVDDVQATAAKATELGGQVMVPPMAITNAGWMAVIVDPTGAALGLWEANQVEGADGFNEPGLMTWNELATRDVDAATAFYSELFGWKAETQDTEGFIYTTFMLNDKPNGGAYDVSGMVPDEHPAAWMVYFAVADSDATVATAAELGATVVREPTESPFGRMAILRDPQGPVFAVIKLTRLA